MRAYEIGDTLFSSAKTRFPPADSIRETSLFPEPFGGIV